MSSVKELAGGLQALHRLTAPETTIEADQPVDLITAIKEYVCHEPNF